MLAATTANISCLSRLGLHVLTFVLRFADESKVMKKRTEYGANMSSSSVK